MDIVTQGLLGGAMAQTVAQPQDVRRHLYIGIVAGLAADADIFINSSSDPLLTLEFHRQFTHSLLFIPLGALIVATVLWLLLRKQMRFTRLYVVCLLGFSLSGFIDACTSYGTQLLWPFSDARIAFNIISIVDPLFTLPLLVFLIFAAVKQRRRYALLGLAWCAVYLGIGVVQQQRATDVATRLIESRGHQAAQLVVKPTFGNLLLWRSLYINDQQIHIDGIRVGAGNTTIYQGEQIARLDLLRDFAALPPDSVQREDIDRFSAFSAQYVALHPQQENVVGDIRYSLLPHSSVPLWGIVIDTHQPQEHARFMTFRNLNPQVREQFVGMLSGTYPGVTLE